jgi:hypothetical protein
MWISWSAGVLAGDNSQRHTRCFKQPAGEAPAVQEVTY